MSGLPASFLVPGAAAEETNLRVEALRHIYRSLEAAHNGETPAVVAVSTETARQLVAASPEDPFILGVREAAGMIDFYASTRECDPGLQPVIRSLAETVRSSAG